MVYSNSRSFRWLIPLNPPFFILRKLFDEILHWYCWANPRCLILIFSNSNFKYGPNSKMVSSSECTTNCSAIAFQIGRSAWQSSFSWFNLPRSNMTSFSLCVVICTLSIANLLSVMHLNESSLDCGSREQHVSCKGNVYVVDNREGVFYLNCHDANSCEDITISIDQFPISIRLILICCLNNLYFVFKIHRPPKVQITLTKSTNIIWMSSNYQYRNASAFDSSATINDAYSDTLTPPPFQQSSHSPFSADKINNKMNMNYYPFSIMLCIAMLMLNSSNGSEDQQAKKKIPRPISMASEMDTEVMKQKSRLPLFVLLSRSDW